MGVIDERSEVIDVTVNGVDRLVVGDVVSMVVSGRVVERRQPYRIDAEPFEIWEPLSNPSQIPNAVVVGVGEGARLDLIAEGAVPPAAHLVLLPRSQPL